MKYFKISVYLEGGFAFIDSINYIIMNKANDLYTQIDFLILK